MPAIPVISPTRFLSGILVERVPVNVTCRDVRDPPQAVTHRFAGGHDPHVLPTISVRELSVEEIVVGAAEDLVGCLDSKCVEEGAIDSGESALVIFAEKERGRQGVEKRRELGGVSQVAKKLMTPSGGRHGTASTRMSFFARMRRREVFLCTSFGTYSTVGRLVLHWHQDEEAGWKTTPSQALRGELLQPHADGQ